MSEGREKLDKFVKKNEQKIKDIAGGKVAIHVKSIAPGTVLFTRDDEPVEFEQEDLDNLVIFINILKELDGTG